MVVVCVKLPKVPRTWTENVPMVALLPAVSVNVLVPVAGFGLKDAVTPRGRLEADKLTLPVKPFCGLTVMAEGTFPPRARLREFGEAERAKSGGGTTVRETVATCDKPPDVPATVTVKVPRAAVALALSVSVLVVVALPGLNAAGTPPSRPEAERLTLLLKPSN